MYDAQEGQDGTEEEEDDSDFDPAGMVVTLTGSDLEASDWEEVHLLFALLADAACCCVLQPTQCLSCWPEILLWLAAPARCGHCN